jgi:hypothetical protein
MVVIGERHCSNNTLGQVLSFIFKDINRNQKEFIVIHSKAC